MYNHQSKYARAIGTLYRNRGQGSPKPGGGKSNVAEEMSGAVSAGMGQHQNRKDIAAKRQTMASAIDTQTKTRDMAQAIQMNQMADAIQRAQIQEEMGRMAKESKDRMRAAEAAQMAPIAGRFTGTGFRDHTKQSDRIGQDIQTSRQIMGHGMMLSPPMHLPLGQAPVGMGGSVIVPKSPEDL